MAQKTIPSLNEVATFDENAVLPIDSGVQTFKIKAVNLAKGLFRLFNEYFDFKNNDSSSNPVNGESRFFFDKNGVMKSKNSKGVTRDYISKDLSMNPVISYALGKNEKTWDNPGNYQEAMGIIGNVVLKSSYVSASAAQAMSSTDMTTWSNVTFPGFNGVIKYFFNFYDSYLDNAYIFAVGESVTGSIVFFKSTDGTSWTLKGTFSGVSNINASFYSASKVTEYQNQLVVFNNGKIYYSNDIGETWLSANLPAGMVNINSFYLKEDFSWYLSGYEDGDYAVKRSTNNGTTWSSISGNMKVFGTINRLFDGSYINMIGADGGFRSYDFINWFPANIPSGVTNLLSYGPYRINIGYIYEGSWISSFSMTYDGMLWGQGLPFNVPTLIPGKYFIYNLSLYYAYSGKIYKSIGM